MNRWGNSEALQQAADRLRKPLATQLGNWRLQGEQPFGTDVLRLLQCPAHFCCTYINVQTGDNITVAVLVGPPGPISAHSPEVCYPSQDFQMTSTRKAFKVRDRSGQEHSLWQLTLQETGVNALPLRVIYGWGTGDDWTATDSPRFAHAQAPTFIKSNWRLRLPNRVMSSTHARISWKCSYHNCKIAWFPRAIPCRL